MRHVFILLFCGSTLLNCSTETTPVVAESFADIGDWERVTATKVSDNDNVKVSFSRSDSATNITFAVVPYVLPSSDDKIVRSTTELVSYSADIIAGTSLATNDTSTEESFKETRSNSLHQSLLNNIVLNVLQETDDENIDAMLLKGQLSVDDEESLIFTRYGEKSEGTLAATVKFSGSTSLVMLDKEDDKSIESSTLDVIEDVHDKVEKYIIPRWRAIFGTEDSEDTLFKNKNDSAIDNKIALFFTSRMNSESEKVMFHYFDLLGSDPLYNPNSNQQKILYCAIPDGETISSAEILAGIAHHLQHMTNYIKKTLTPYQSGADTSPEFETTFLDEGLSVLAEELTGYGDYAFQAVSSYLANNKTTAIASGVDSIASRGGTYLLLRHLIEREGGIKYGSSSATSVSGGGLDFITSLYSSSDLQGIANIEHAMHGESFSEIISKFTIALILNGYELSVTPGSNHVFPSESEDPFTGNTLGISILGNTRTIGSSTLTLDGPKIDASMPVGESISLLPSALPIYTLSMVEGGSANLTFTAEGDSELGMVVVRVK